VAFLDRDEAGEGPRDRLDVAVLARLGGAQSPVEARVGRGQIAALDEAKGEPGARGDVRRARGRRLERRQVLVQDALGAGIVALDVIALAQVLARERLKRNVARGLPHRQATRPVVERGIHLAL
jgi:hypothetical protein